jgi:hypothetical protein
MEVVDMSTVVAERESTTSTGPGRATRTCAVAWINGRGAIVVRTDLDGSVSTATIERGLEPEPVFLDLVVRAIGARERVVILGPSTVRLALEREYVGIYQRPDRLVDVEPSGPVSEDELIDRVRQLAS